MKNLKRILCLALCLMLTLACLPAMAAGSVKIGVLAVRTMKSTLPKRMMWSSSIPKS